mmetsp:Transcript_785/g.1190  ORF Transcript_785/g.1190 Transcript_785/m.1190 type:complete len:86 (+) Transcript_785:2348-2605(+)
MQLVETFIKVGISNHPSVSACYTKYMVTNLPALEVRSMVSKQLNMEIEIKDLKGTVEALEKKLMVAQSTADKAVSLANKAAKKKE